MTESLSPIASLGGTTISVTAPSLPKPAEGLAEESGFATALADMVASANADLKRAEAMSVAGIKGEAETHEVVTALMSAEQSLRMAVAVRDKIVQAYLDLSRMQI